MLEIVITHVNLRTAVCMAPYFVLGGVRVVISPVAIENVIEYGGLLAPLYANGTAVATTIL